MITRLGLSRLITRRWLTPGRAVIIDTETTDLDGAILEIAIIDAATGTVLLDTLVKPDEPIAAEAQRIHGISAAMCRDAPQWRHVASLLAHHTQGKIVLAWNAAYDATVIDRQQQRHGLAPLRRHWRCAMKLDAWARHVRWQKLNGGHRALADTQAVRARLQHLAANPQKATP